MHYGKDSQKQLEMANPKPKRVYIMPEDQSPKQSHLPRNLRQEFTKATSRYDKDIEYKNRILKEKEKRVFNKKAVQKMNSKKIST